MAAAEAGQEGKVSYYAYYPFLINTTGAGATSGGGYIVRLQSKKPAGDGTQPTRQFELDYTQVDPAWEPKQSIRVLAAYALERKYPFINPKVPRSRDVENAVLASPFAGLDPRQVLLTAGNDDEDFLFFPAGRAGGDVAARRSMTDSARGAAPLLLHVGSRVTAVVAAHFGERYQVGCLMERCDGPLQQYLEMHRDSTNQWIPLTNALVIAASLAEFLRKVGQERLKAYTFSYERVVVTLGKAPKFEISLLPTTLEGAPDDTFLGKAGRGKSPTRAALALPVRTLLNLIGAPVGAVNVSRGFRRCLSGFGCSDRPLHPPDNVNGQLYRMTPADMEKKEVLARMLEARLGPAESLVLTRLEEVLHSALTNSDNDLQKALTTFIDGCYSVAEAVPTEKGRPIGRTQAIATTYGVLRQGKVDPKSQKRDTVAWAAMTFVFPLLQEYLRNGQLLKGLLQFPKPPGPPPSASSRTAPAPSANVPAPVPGAKAEPAKAEPTTPPRVAPSPPGSQALGAALAVPPSSAVLGLPHPETPTQPQRAGHKMKTATAKKKAPKAEPAPQPKVQVPMTMMEELALRQQRKLAKAAAGPKGPASESATAQLASPGPHTFPFPPLRKAQQEGATSVTGKDDARTEEVSAESKSPEPVTTTEKSEAARVRELIKMLEAKQDLGKVESTMRSNLTLRSKKTIVRAAAVFRDASM